MNSLIPYVLSSFASDYVERFNEYLEKKRNPQPGDHVEMVYDGTSRRVPYGIVLTDTDAQGNERCSEEGGLPVQLYDDIKQGRTNFICTGVLREQPMSFEKNDSYNLGIHGASGIPNIPMAGNPQDGYTIWEESADYYEFKDGGRAHVSVSSFLRDSAEVGYLPYIKHLYQSYQACDHRQNNPLPGDHVSIVVASTDGVFYENVGIVLSPVDQEGTVRCEEKGQIPYQHYNMIKQGRTDHICDTAHSYQRDCKILESDTEIPNLPLSGNPIEGYTVWRDSENI